MSLSRTLSEQVHIIFIIKLLSSETNEAMRENKGNFFFRKKNRAQLYVTMKKISIY